MPNPALRLRKPTACPKCGSADIRLILYGHPNAEAVAMILRGLACVGGCLMDRWLPDWRCHDCRHEWLDPLDPAKQELEGLVERILQSADPVRALAA
jgi:hypothetical protein